MEPCVSSVPVEMSDACRWVVGMYRHHGRLLELSAEMERCIDTICVLAAPYNLATLGGSPTPDTLMVDRRMVSVLYVGDLATFDGDGLTRLVIAAHRNCVRIGVHPWRAHLDDARAELVRRRMVADYAAEMGVDVDEVDDDGCGLACIEITAHPRTIGASHLFDRHPGLDELSERSSPRLLSSSTTTTQLTEEEDR